MADKNETKPVKTNPDETKPDETGTNEPEPVKTTLKDIKKHPKFFEIPLLDVETLQLLTKHMQEKAGMAVDVYTSRHSDGRLFVGVLPIGTDTTGYDVD